MSYAASVPASYINSYQTMFDNMIITPSHLWEVDAAVAKINAGKAAYQAISNITNVPWTVIGMIHYHESNCDFTKHLHNGDPLSARTVQVPAGHPVTGNPPFTFTQSAIDALQYNGLTAWKDWSVPGQLYILEGYNGYGYHSMNINSPYLWSYTQYYTKGLYIKDHVFDANAVSKQAGVATILRRVMEKNNMYATVAGISAGVLILIAGIIYLLVQNKTV